MYHMHACFLKQYVIFLYYCNTYKYITIFFLSLFNLSHLLWKMPMSIRHHISFDEVLQLYINRIKTLFFKVNTFLHPLSSGARSTGCVRVIILIIVLHS